MIMILSISHYQNFSIWIFPHPDIKRAQRCAQQEEVGLSCSRCVANLHIATPWIFLVARPHSQAIQKVFPITLIYKPLMLPSYLYGRMKVCTLPREPVTFEPIVIMYAHANERLSTFIA